MATNTMLSSAIETLPIRRRRPTPADCFYCEYDRKIDVPEGGWMYMGNNGPYVACPICNPDGSHPRS